VVLLRTEHYNAIVLHAEADYPYECCGILLGRFLSDGKQILDVVPISNARTDEAKRTRFLIEPHEYLLGEKKARERELDIIGFYHSHPDHSAIPSEYDRLHAWPLYSYIIVSVKEGSSSEMFSWQLQEDRERFFPELIIEGN
jgi:proteasome lid subunit RPN8/RPN11